MLKYATLTSPFPIATLQGSCYSYLLFTHEEIGSHRHEILFPGIHSPKWWSTVFLGGSGRFILRMFIARLRKGEGIFFISHNSVTTLKKNKCVETVGEPLNREDLLEEAGSGLL
jgi:hypothetical protein